MSTVIRLAVLAVAFALITIAVGWWAVAVVGVLWGWLAGSGIRYTRTLSAVAASLAWLAILTVGAVRGEGRALLEAISGLFPVPGALVVAATIGLAALLAGLGAWLGTGLRPASGPSSDAH
jgi:hypothetical protein